MSRRNGRLGAKAGAAPAWVAVVVSLAAGPAAAGKPTAPKVDPLGPPVDVSALKAQLVVLSDGKGHYLTTMPPTAHQPEHLAYGDGKTLSIVRGSGWMQVGPEMIFRFWEPRVASDGRLSDDGLKGSVSFSLGEAQYKIVCGARQTVLTPLGDAQRAALMNEARFFGPRWKYRAYALARDDRGQYYYVDREREPEDSPRFRLFVGVKGNLKLQQMTNIVNDTQGDIFATKSGSLRLILGKDEASWVAGEKKRPLTVLSVVDNAHLIYSDLGVYDGQRLGTPCDDL